MGSQSTTLVGTFVELADTVVADFDLVDFFTMLATRCTELFDVDAVGVLLADPEGNLNVTGSSSPDVRRLEVFELQHDEGPSPESYRTGTFITSAELTDDHDRWPQFVSAALGLGMRSAHAFPLRSRGTVVGALNLLAARAGPMSRDDLTNAQALADIATIGLVRQRAAQESDVRNEQLQRALRSRNVIEQAKGYVRHNRGVDVETAFALLRDHARSHNRRLVDVASDILDKRLPGSALGPAGGKQKPRAVVIHPPSEIDHDTCVAFEAQLGRTDPTGTTTIDFADVSFCDSSCIRALILHAKRHRAAGGDLQVTNPRPAVRHVFDIVGISTLIGLRDAGPVRA